MTQMLLKHLSRGFQSSIFVPILYSVIASLGLILAIWRQADIGLDKKHMSKSDEKFDFIIVGAGSAGCLVANRLSRYYKVLLLEAGGEPHPLQSIPGFSVFLVNYPETDWRHLSVPQRQGSLNSINQQSSWSAGIGLGGTSSINLMLYLRGNPRDYDSWANITGDPSWSYEAVVPFFKKHEKYGNPNGDPRYHGFDGEMNIELPEFTGVADEFIQAGKELGYPEIDINARHEEGFFKLYHNTENGVRDSAFRAFIKPIRNRKLLTIRKYSVVTKVSPLDTQYVSIKVGEILFRNGNRQVFGVEYERHGRTERAMVRKEVIISAGAITTPKLLMLSGIGPADHLKELGIPVRHNLPVGNNLQDHTSVYLGPLFIESSRTTLLDRDITAGAFVKWFTTGGGHLSSSGAHASAVFSSAFAEARGEGDWPDIQLFMFGYSVHPGFYQTFAKSFGLKEDELKSYYEGSENKNSVLIAISGARPLSRGNIRLSGSSPHDTLKIEPNYLNDPFDLDVNVLLEGVKATLFLFENTTTMKELGAKYYTKSLPGCEHLPFRSDAYWICYIRRYTVTLHHPCGTASMGPSDSPFSVVDPQLRVRGVDNLRVIDASVMPQIPVTNTQAGTLMIGEKGADMILKQWNGLGNFVEG